jgi:threonine aldolase
MASPDGSVDLRSDTVTTPTPEMRRAMADAEVGDDEYGEDPTVNRLQSLAAALVGTESALYVPSGTMANQLALRVLARAGTDVLCAQRAHVYRYEDAGAAGNAGVQLRPLPDDDGRLDPATIVGALADAEHHIVSVSLLSIENTHMPSGGQPWTIEQVEEVATVARAADLPVHCDGARIWNAAIALGVSPRDLVAPTTSTMFCLSKGLGAPVGSLLCGPADLIAAAREQRHRMGGGMRQAGVIAAAGIVALETMVERLADDHARARRLADALAARFPGSVDPSRVPTNIVCVPATQLPGHLLERLESQGIRAGMIDAETVRFVTHKDVDDADLDRVIVALDDVATG